MRLYFQKYVINKLVPKYLNKGWTPILENQDTTLMKKIRSTNKDELIIMLIREKYSINDELSLLRQRDTKPDDYQEYFDYVEECKRLVNEALINDLKYKNHDEELT